MISSFIITIIVIIIFGLIVNFFTGKENISKEQEKEVEKGVKKIKRIINSMKKEFIAIKTIPLKENISSENIKKSKFGGNGYFPKDMEYPKNSKGDCLMFLAQINFEEVPEIKNYPKSGILQFYIDGTDGGLGFNYGEDLSQKDFRIIYHENTEKEFITDFSFLDKYDFSENSPFSFEGKYKEFLLNFERKTEKISLSDYRLEKIVNDNSKKELSDYIYEEIIENIDEEENSNHKIGGFPNFTQNDVRSEEKYNNYELLFQMDSELINKKWEICFGDTGTINFFIKEEDLINKDFSKILSNIDCY